MRWTVKRWKSLILAGYLGVIFDPDPLWLFSSSKLSWVVVHLSCILKLGPSNNVINSYFQFCCSVYFLLILISVLKLLEYLHHHPHRTPSPTYISLVQHLSPLSATPPHAPSLHLHHPLRTSWGQMREVGGREEQDSLWHWDLSLSLLGWRTHLPASSGNPPDVHRRPRCLEHALWERLPAESCHHVPVSKMVITPEMKWQPWGSQLRFENHCKHVTLMSFVTTWWKFSSTWKVSSECE